MSDNGAALPRSSAVDERSHGAVNPEATAIGYAGSALTPADEAFIGQVIAASGQPTSQELAELRALLRPAVKPAADAGGAAA